MQRAGFHELAALDFNAHAVATFQTNFRHVSKDRAREVDLATFEPEHLDALLMPANSRAARPCVDVIVGGPPCQGFSPVRRVDGANHGDRLVEDERRYLYKRFLAYVRYFQPRVFVMENVLGIKSAAGGEFFSRVQSEARALGYRVHGEELRAWRYGVPQKRIRQLIIGTRRELPIFTSARWLAPTHTDPDAASTGTSILQSLVTLWEAIGDLPPLAADEGEDECSVDQQRRQSQLDRYGGRFLKKVVAAHGNTVISGHVSRPHSARDLRDFALLHEGESSAVAMRERAVEFEWPYSKAHFKDRYTRQHRNRLCSTIVAHLSKDGLMFIHPTQNRSLTPREAARVQTFPDWFRFPAERTHAFRLIGNAVPPLLAEAVGRGVRGYLSFAKREENRPARLEPLPRDVREAITWLQPLADAAKNGTLATVPLEKFRRGWFALGCLHPRLHPDGIRENGKRQVSDSGEHAGLLRIAPELASPIFEQSGWPVCLVPIASEANRRHRDRELREDEYNFSDAQLAGTIWLQETE